MLFCCLWRKVEISCHKHFVVVSRHQQAPPLTTSGKCYNLPQSGGTVLITPSRSQRWQHAMKSDISSESRFLHTPPAGFPSEYCYDVWHGKTRMVCLPDGEKGWRYFYSFRQNPRTWRTDRQTDGRIDTAWRLRPRLHIIAPKKTDYYNVQHNFTSSKKNTIYFWQG